MKQECSGGGPHPYASREGGRDQYYCQFLLQAFMYTITVVPSLYLALIWNKNICMFRVSPCFSLHFKIELSLKDLRFITELKRCFHKFNLVTT